jgi:Zn-dependent peptidase ImmA (M78 family)
MKELKEIEKRSGVDLSDLYNVFPVKIGEICDRLNIEVIFDENMPEDYSGQIKFENEKYIIKINDKKNLHHNIFTLAHELGHFVRHSEIVKKDGFIDRKKTEYEPSKAHYEIEANQFAAELLMPEEKFREVYKTTSGNLTALQGIFRVSFDAINYRALNLGLLLG